jgi:hypothetical protein
LQLARAKVTYSGLELPITTVAIIKRIPITDSLTEDAFIDKLEDVEAAMHTIAIVWLIGVERNKDLGVSAKNVS